MKCGAQVSDVQTLAGSGYLVTTWIPCTLDAGHNGRHWSNTADGREVRWGRPWFRLVALVVAILGGLAVVAAVLFAAVVP